MRNGKFLFAEFIGTFVLVFIGCGSAIFSATYPELGIGFVGVSLAFGLSVMTMLYAVSHIPDAGMFNPAITIAIMVKNNKFQNKLLLAILAQLLGAISAATILYTIFTGKPDTDIGNFAANGYAEHSPDGYNLISAFLTETISTFIFVFIIFGTTSKNAIKEFAGIVIGLTLTMIHLVTIPITNTSVNPARSTSQAIFVGDWALEQLWLFWLAPIVGAIIAAFVAKLTFPEN